MATTSNKGWPYPLGTDLVVEGDNAIRAIADQLDARMGEYVITPADVLNGTVNPDGSVILNAAAGAWCEFRNVFTSRYRFYRIAFNVAGTSSGSLLMRYMIGTAQQAQAGGYTNQRWFASGAAVNAATSNDAYGIIGSVSASQHSGESIIYDPVDVTQATRAIGSDMGGGLPGGVGITRGSNILSENGIAIQKAAGTTTGWLKIFGM